MEALLIDGPLEGTRLSVEAVGGRSSRTLDIPDRDGKLVRYCLAEWTQEGDAMPGGARGRCPDFRFRPIPTIGSYTIGPRWGKEEAAASG